MKKPVVNIIIAVVVIVGAALIYYATRPPEAVPTIKIGVIGPMQFVQGIGHWNGATMAADEINAAGGVQVGDKKMNIELVQADSNEFINITVENTV